jgi:hypothetical protein
MKILRQRIYEQQLEKQEKEYNAQRKTQIGTGSRSERIRTYNFSQGRVIDHRVGVTAHNIELVSNETRKKFGGQFETEEKILHENKTKQIKKENKTNRNQRKENKKKKNTKTKHDKQKRKKQKKATNKTKQTSEVKETKQHKTKESNKQTKQIQNQVMEGEIDEFIEQCRFQERTQQLQQL